MSAWMSDAALRHLRGIAAAPELEGTRYRILRPIGRGGMADVYLAEDDQLGRNVALKVLPAADAGGERAAVLLREARILARLEHPGIVPVHDAGQLPDGRVYYAMKFVQGQRLDDHVQQTASLAARIRLFERICDTVAFAHANGVIHRDLKPENIMVGPFGEVLVLDWGVAKLGVDDLGVVAGTPAYMAPEQAAGGEVDARADVYALGCLLRCLFQGLDQRGAKPLLSIARKAMAQSPDERYATVPDLSADVQRFLEGVRVQAHPESFAERAARLARRHRTAIVLVLAYLVMRVALLLWFRR